MGRRFATRVEIGDEIQTILHRKFQSACAYVAHFDHGISVELMLHSQAPGENFGEPRIEGQVSARQITSARPGPWEECKSVAIPPPARKPVCVAHQEGVGVRPQAEP